MVRTRWLRSPISKRQGRPNQMAGGDLYAVRSMRLRGTPAAPSQVKSRSLYRAAHPSLLSPPDFVCHTPYSDSKPANSISRNCVFQLLAIPVLVAGTCISAASSSQGAPRPRKICFCSTQSLIPKNNLSCIGRTCRVSCSCLVRTSSHLSRWPAAVHRQARATTNSS